MLGNQASVSVQPCSQPAWAALRNLAAKRQLWPGAGMCPAWLPGPQAGVQGFLDALSFLLPPLQKPEGLKGRRLTMLLLNCPVKSLIQHASKGFVTPGMHLNSLLQKPLMQTRPFQHFLLSNFPSLPKSRGANPRCVSLGHDCPSLISNNTPEPQSGENRQQWNTYAWDHSRKAGSPHLCL